VVDGPLVKKVSGNKKRLQMVLKKITRQNLPDDKEAFGGSVGREAWCKRTANCPLAGVR